MGEENNHFKTIKPTTSPPRKPIIPYSHKILKASLRIVNPFGEQLRASPAAPVSFKPA
jgi:hypothetical protein